MRKTKLLSLLVLLLTAVTQGTWAQRNLLDGVFSVSATKKVSFAQGNLQATYNGSNWSWAFAEHQWDYIGNAAGNTKVTASSPYISENATVDLFGWVGASSTWTGVNKYGITSSSATNNKNGYGNGASESLKSDWGALIGLGWRTLSMAEWTYLLTTRTVNGGKGADKSYTLNQSVNGKKGMVIYPDNYTGAVYSGSNWASFEAAGCVFLPAAGWRNGATINNINDRGFYWSSTPANTTDAKRMFFAGGLDLGDTNSRAFGFSVRLVKEYSLSTDATGDFIIASKADWEKFCSDINNGSTYSGQTVKLTADISGITTRTSNDLKNPFCGTFDGQGHTMNLNISVTTSDATSAPFGYIENATVKNLHITGTETTAGLRIASIAGFAKSSTITNCWSEVALSSSSANDIDCGAFVAHTESGSTVTLNGCLFTGSITYSNAAGYEGGGMVGWAKGTVKLNDCVFAPSAITIAKYQSHNMFIGNASGTLTNCYYNDVAAASSLTKQAKQMRSITAGDGVTSLVISGDDTEYDVSAITAYATGLKYNDVYYAGNGESVSLTYAGTKSVKSVTAKRKTTTGNITVYFTDVLNYGDVHVYYWNDGPDWPGTPMTEVGTNEYSQKIYKAVIPATPEGIIFNGNGRQTVDITENIADGSWWYTTDQLDGGKNEVVYNNKYTEDIEVTKVSDNQWTFTMPDGNVELDIEYYPAYPVTISDGDVDAANWSATPTEQSVGQNVTLKYTGRKKIKRITIEAVPAPTARTAAEATAEDIGKLIGADGNIYDDAAAATAASTTAVAMIAYVGNDAETSTTYNHGLALALGDVSDTKNWCSQTEATCLGTGHQFDSEAGAKGDMAGIDNTDYLIDHAPAGHAHDAASAARGYNSGTHPAGTSAWFLPSAGQWDKMAAAAGSYANLIANAGLQGGWDAAYWSSTEGGADFAWFFDSSQGRLDGYSKDEEFRVRACLAF